MKESFALTTTGARFYLAADVQHRSIYQRTDISDELYTPAAGFEVYGTQRITSGSNKVNLTDFDRYYIGKDLEANLHVDDNANPSKLLMVIKARVSVKALGNVLFAVDFDLTCSSSYMGKLMKFIPRSTSTAVSLGNPMMVYIFDNNRDFDYDRSVRYWFLMAVNTLEPEIEFTYEINTDPQIVRGNRETIDVNMVCTAINGALQYLSLA